MLGDSSLEFFLTTFIVVDVFERARDTQRLAGRIALGRSVRPKPPILSRADLELALDVVRRSSGTIIEMSSERGERSRLVIGCNSDAQLLRMFGKSFTPE